MPRRLTRWTHGTGFAAFYKQLPRPITMRVACAGGRSGLTQTVRLRDDPQLPSLRGLHTVRSDQLPLLGRLVIRGPDPSLALEIQGR